MRNYILTTLVLASVVVGCTKSNFVDIPEIQKTPITFETYTGKTPTTKATQETTLTLAEKTSSESPAFHVKAFYGSELYMDEALWSTCTVESSTDENGNETKTITNQGWTYGGTTYWPANGSLDFYAFGISSNLTKATETTYSYTVQTAVSSQDDLIVATPVNQSGSTNTTVSLNFKHLLSRVGFTLMTTNNTSAVEVRIKSLKLIGDFYSSGTVDLTAATPVITATGNATETTYSLLADNYSASVQADYRVFRHTKAVTANGVPIYPNSTLKTDGTYDETDSGDENDRFMMLIPGTMPSKVDIIYQLPGTSDQHVELDLTSEVNKAKLSFDEFKAGKAYEFIIKVSTDKIDFTGEVKDWDPVDGADTPIPQPEE